MYVYFFFVNILNFFFNSFLNGFSSFVKFSHNGKYLLSSSLDGNIKLWNFLTEKKIKVYNGHVNEQYCISADFDKGTHVVSGSEDKCIYIWDIQSKQIVQKLEGHTGILIILP